MTLPADSTVRVRSGDLIEVPLTLTPDQVNVTGFEFEVEFNVDELEFVDMRTGNLLKSWMTYVNVHDVKDGKQRVSFGGMDYSPGTNSNHILDKRTYTC